MNRGDKEVYKAINEKFGSTKLGDEAFSSKDYWSTVPVDEEGNAHELSRSNPDVLAESSGLSYEVVLSRDEKDRLNAIKKARLTRRQRAIVELLGAGHTLGSAGKKLGISKTTAYENLAEARVEIERIYAEQKALRGQ